MNEPFEFSANRRFASCLSVLATYSLKSGVALPNLAGYRKDLASAASGLPRIRPLPVTFAPCTSGPPAAHGRNYQRLASVSPAVCRCTLTALAVSGRWSVSATANSESVQLTILDS